jgi:hypothetical protein
MLYLLLLYLFIEIYLLRKVNGKFCYARLYHLLLFGLFYSWKYQQPCKDTNKPKCLLMTFRKCYEIFLFLICEKLTKINLIHMCMFYIDDRSIMWIFRSFLSTPSNSAVSFEIGGNFKPNENSVLIVAVPDTKSNFNCNQSRFCKVTPEICR